MHTLKAEIQVTELHLHAKENFQRAAEHRKSADAQHANAQQPETWGVALEADAARLFGETQLVPPAPDRKLA